MSGRIGDIKEMAARRPPTTLLHHMAHGQSIAVPRASAARTDQRQTQYYVHPSRHWRSPLARIVQPSDPIDFASNLHHGTQTNVTVAPPPCARLN